LRGPNKGLHLTPGSGVPWLETTSVAPAQVKRGDRRRCLGAWWKDAADGTGGDDVE